MHSEWKVLRHKNVYIYPCSHNPKGIIELKAVCELNDELSLSLKNKTSNCYIKYSHAVFIQMQSCKQLVSRMITEPRFCLGQLKYA